MAKSNKKEDEQKSAKKAQTMRERIEGAAAKQDKKKAPVQEVIPASNKKVRSNKDVAAKEAKVKKPSPLEGRSFWGAFFWGFTLPIRWIWKPIAWVLKRIIPPYFKNSWKEIKLVTWPSLGTTTKLTFVVLAFSLVFGLAIAGVDWVLDKGFKEFILQ